MIGLVVAARVMIRLSEAANLLYGLAFRRDQARRLPWAYVRQRVRADPVCWLTLATIVGFLLLMPTGYAIGIRAGQDTATYRTLWFGSFS